MLRTLLPAFYLFLSLPATGQHRLEFRDTPEKPALFGDGIISTPINERDMAIAPDGRELYFTISTPRSTFQTIVCMKKDAGGSWSSPQVAPFCGRFSDLEPAFSPDGSRLYFASNRPLNGDTPKDFDIWYVERVSSGWGQPQRLGAPVNTPADEFYPSIARSGNLYFTAAYPGGIGREDIYLAGWKEGAFQQPVPLDTAVNSAFYEFNAFVSPDEQFILFTSYGRKDDQGGGDLYVSMRDERGRWQPARHLPILNSDRLDYCPYISPDGKTLFFTSERHDLPISFKTAASYRQVAAVYNGTLNGLGNIYWVRWPEVLQSLTGDPSSK